MKNAEDAETQRSQSVSSAIPKRCRATALQRRLVQLTSGCPIGLKRIGTSAPRYGDTRLNSPIRRNNAILTWLQQLKSTIKGIHNASEPASLLHPRDYSVHFWFGCAPNNQRKTKGLL